MRCGEARGRAVEKGDGDAVGSHRFERGEDRGRDALGARRSGDRGGDGLPDAGRRSGEDRMAARDRRSGRGRETPSHQAFRAVNLSFRNPIDAGRRGGEIWCATSLSECERRSG